MYRHKTIISHVCPSLCRKGDSLHRDRIEHILSRGESPGSFDVVVMPTKKKVRTEVEVLVPAVTCYIRRVRYAQPKPQFVTLAPRIYFLNTKTGHHEMKRRRQVSPQGVPIEVGSIENIPGRVDGSWIPNHCRKRTRTTCGQTSPPPRQRLRQPLVIVSSGDRGFVRVLGLE